MIVYLIRNVFVFLLTFFIGLSFFTAECVSTEKASENCIVVSGAVNTAMTLNLNNLKELPPFHIKNVPLIRETREKDPKKELISAFNYQGVLLRDILEKTGMKYKRKWEPLVYVRVRGLKNEEVVFSFGEIFYSSIGRSILIAYEKNGNPIDFIESCGELIVATDIRCGRWIPNVKEIIVERVDIEMHAYQDKKDKILRPPTTQFLIVDNKTSKSQAFTLQDLANLPSVPINSAVMIGDCEGFKGVFSFEGPSLRSLLEKFLTEGTRQSYDRFVVISSGDGFSAVFSFGEIFNSRLENNIIIAIKKNGEILGPNDGFAMSVVAEDMAGGRSVKRIKKMEIF